MNRDTNSPWLPSLTGHFLENGAGVIDNLFAALGKQSGMRTSIGQAGFHKRSRRPAQELVYCLLLWVFVKVESMGGFARESLRRYCAAEIEEWHRIAPCGSILGDAEYDTLNSALPICALPYRPRRVWRIECF